MVVVPSFSQSEYAHDCIVSAVVMRVEWLLAPDVADGVDAPRHVMDQEYSYESSPDEPQKYTNPTQRKHSSEHSRYQQPYEYPHWKLFTDLANKFVFAKITNIPH